MVCILNAVRNGAPETKVRVQCLGGCGYDWQKGNAARASKTHFGSAPRCAETVLAADANAFSGKQKALLLQQQKQAQKCAWVVGLASVM